MFKKLVLILLAFNASNHVHSQSEGCNCKTDLESLHEKIIKSAPYKLNKIAYEKAYKTFLGEVESVKTNYDCYVMLNTLILTLKDNHSKIYGLDTGANKIVRSDSTRFKAFKESDLFKAYPRLNINLDSLKSALDKKSIEDVEGIYNYNNELSIGVYNSSKSNTFKAVILDSNSDIWQVGEQLYSIVKYNEESYLVVGGGVSSKRLITFNEKIKGGYFYTARFIKEKNNINYATDTLVDSTYYIKELNKNITYLKIGSFNSWQPTLGKAERFYKKIDGSLKTENLIIDLRNNGGGGNRNSNILYKIVKEYAKKNKVYVLINFLTTSNAEQFAHRLSQLENCTLLGQSTNGTLAYEIKDSVYELNCGVFLAQLTSKRHDKYLEFESKGVKPDKYLESGSDWVRQIESLIESN